MQYLTSRTDLECSVLWFYPLSLCGLDSKASAYSVGDLGSIPGSGRSPGEDPLVKAAHSSVLAWKIPWTEEPGRIQSMGLQTVGH